MLEKGVKIVLVKPMDNFDRVGEICTIEKIVGDYILFTFGKNNIEAGVINSNLFNNYFEIYEGEENIIPAITKEHVIKIIRNSDIVVDTIFDKCTVVNVKLPNGFVITESSACVSPENYSVDVGYEACIDKIINKIWELEGYRLQCDLYESNFFLENEDSCPHNTVECCGCGLCD